MINIDLTDKVALVTGGARGIGAEIVKKFSLCNAKVAFCYKDSVKAAEDLLKNIDNQKVKAYRFSINDDKEVIKNIKTIIEDFGQIDILVNNAGVNKDAFFGMMSKETWDTVIDTALKGIFNVTHTVIRKMVTKKNNGVVINVSSIAGILGTAGQVNYSTAKAGIIGFTKALAREYAKYNIRVVCIAPGFINTDMFNKIPQDLKNDMIQSVPLKRIGEPEDIAYMASFLASDLAKYITGQVFVVDGGIV
ncbi:MAG: 3-oxoacyl-ACP reductase FabG [Spirochaetales bacterium]|nr:3-oxoacyl-ACP reductase FabG [Spirochaetales bacterium]